MMICTPQKPVTSPQCPSCCIFECHHFVFFYVLTYLLSISLPPYCSLSSSIFPLRCSMHTSHGWPTSLLPVPPPASADVTSCLTSLPVSVSVPSQAALATSGGLYCLHGCAVIIHLHEHCIDVWTQNLMSDLVRLMLHRYCMNVAGAAWILHECCIGTVLHSRCLAIAWALHWCYNTCSLICDRKCVESINWHYHMYLPWVTCCCGAHAGGD